jgi:hypothetical protein
MFRRQNASALLEFRVRVLFCVRDPPQRDSNPCLPSATRLVIISRTW